MTPALLLVSLLSLTELTAEEVVRTATAGGVHFRVRFDRGPVHVFKPHGYARETAGIVLYVHGYFTPVDRAWAEHRLAEQFARSRQNALFVAPEAPSSKAEAVFFPDPKELLLATSRATNLVLPDGPVIMLGHSGAYRTMAEWLKWRRLDEVILLDGLYAREEELGAWLESDEGRRTNKLLLVSIETARRAEAFLERFPLAARSDRTPGRLDEIRLGARRSQLFHLAIGTTDHMGLVTGGALIPVLLGVTPLARIR